MCYQHPTRSNGIKFKFFLYINSSLIITKKNYFAVFKQFSRVLSEPLMQWDVCNSTKYYNGFLTDREICVPPGEIEARNVSIIIYLYVYIHVKFKYVTIIIIN